MGVGLGNPTTLNSPFSEDPLQIQMSPFIFHGSHPNGNGNAMGMEIVNQLQTEGLREGRGDGPIIKAKWCRQKEEGALGR